MTLQLFEGQKINLLINFTENIKPGDIKTDQLAYVKPFTWDCLSHMKFSFSLLSGVFSWFIRIYINKNCKACRKHKPSCCYSIRLPNTSSRSANVSKQWYKL